LHAEKFWGNDLGEIFSGFGIAWGIFQRWEGGIFCGMDSPRENFLGRNSSWGNFLQKQLPTEEKIPKRGISRGNGKIIRN